MINLDKVAVCAATRTWAASVVADSLKPGVEISEAEFSQFALNAFSKNADVTQSGWYEPPPGGVAALFAVPPDYERLEFDTLRKETYWPQKDRILSQDGVGLLYVSPVHRETGIIGDFGITVYRGSSPEVLDHFAKCLNTLERVASEVEVGMALLEVHERAQQLFKANGLTNARTVTWTDKTGTNLGHTIPWSYEVPEESESKVIKTGDMNQLKDLISNKRLYLNTKETFLIPETIAFSLEARLESIENPSLPNVFYHFIIAFDRRKKKVLANYNEIFDAVGMKNLRCSFG
jgi:Metallopeptidase family M24